MSDDPLAPRWCDLGTGAEGQPVPVDRGAPGSVPIPAMGVQVSVFATAAEAAAYLSGLIDADLTLRAGRGEGLLSGVVARAIGARTSEICDRGGLAALSQQITWRGLADLEGPDPSGHPITVDLNPGEPPGIIVRGHRLTVSGDLDDLVIEAAHDLPRGRVQRAAWDNDVLRWADVTVDDATVRLRTSLSALIADRSALCGLARVIDEARHRDADAAIEDWVRRDPAHLEILARMRAGWRLVRHHGTASFFPPDGDARPGRTLSSAMVGRLLQARLIHRPLSLERLYRANPWRSSAEDGVYDYLPNRDLVLPDTTASPATARSTKTRSAKEGSAKGRTAKTHKKDQTAEA